MAEFLQDLASLPEFSTSTRLTIIIRSTDGKGNEQKATLPTSAELNALNGTGLSSAELGVLNGVTAGTVTASKAVVVDANKDIGTIRHLTISGNLVTGATTLSETELGYLDGLAAGTVTASKALVVDANKDLATLRHLTISGNLVTGATTLSETELGYLDGLTIGTVTASKALVVDANKDLASLRHLTLAGNLLTAANVGTPGTNVTAVEYGDAYNHVTVLTLTAVELTPTIPADAEGAGAVIYTFPAGVYAGHMAHMDITAGVMDAATNAADVGLGSLIASGDIATLTTAAMEDWVTGQTVANVQTFVVEKSTVMTAGASLVFEAGGSHTLNLNVAATWNGTVATASVTGTVTIYWTFLGA